MKLTAILLLVSLTACGQHKQVRKSFVRDNQIFWLTLNATADSVIIYGNKLNEHLDKVIWMQKADSMMGGTDYRLRYRYEDELKKVRQEHIFYKGLYARYMSMIFSNPGSVSKK